MIEDVVGPQVGNDIPDNNIPTPIQPSLVLVSP